MISKKLLISVCLFFCGIALLLGESSELMGDEPKEGQPQVILLEVQGSINPALADYIIKGIQKAEEQRSACVIIRMDTPGGLMTTTKTLIKEMINARVPVIVYVAPSGSSAASAGALITMAADIAAMAPGTNLGAAHPVEGSGRNIDSDLSEKILNDLTAYMRGVVGKKGRNVDWAEKAIRESVSITAKEALEINVIDLIADSVPELLDKLNGRKLEKGGISYTFHTKNAKLEKIETGWRFKILDAVADPNVAYVLLLIAGIGITAEIYNPGGIFPGVVGGICALLSLFALQVLPVNYVGILLILLSLILFVMELKVVSHGLLAIGGIISLTLGSIMLFESDESAMRVSWSVILPTVAVVSAFFIVSVSLVMRAWLRQPRTGDVGLIGEVGSAITDLNPEGVVALHGEYWNARTDSLIPSGEKIRVIRVDGLVVVVTRDMGA